MSINLKSIFKILVSLILIYWTISSGSTNYENVLIGITNFKLTFTFLILTFLQLFISTLRTSILMQFNNQKSYSWKILKISWASLFISSVVPIAILGEIYRIKQLTMVNENNVKDNSFYSSMYSKFFSTVSLIILVLIAEFFSGEVPKEISRVNPFFYLFIGSIVVFFLFKSFIMPKFLVLMQHFHNLQQKSFFKKRIINFAQYNKEFFASHKKPLLVATYSFLIQSLNVISIFLIVDTLNPDLNAKLVDVLCVIPIGIFFMTLPISFSGLGVGHLAFAKLLGIFNISNGADVFTIYFIFSYLFNMMGMIPFLSLLDLKKDIKNLV